MRWHTERATKQEQYVQVERLARSRVPHPGMHLLRKPHFSKEFTMPTLAARYPYSLLTACMLTVLLCAGLAMNIVGWTPGASGLPVGVAMVKR